MVWFKIVGCDLSTKSVAFGFIDLERNECCTAEVIEIGNLAEDRFDGLITQVDTLLETLAEYPTVLYVEKIPFVRNAKAALDLSSILGGIRAVCIRYGIGYHLVQNLSWKKGIGLRGKVTKDDTEQLMIQKYDIIPEDWPLSENQYDSLGIATYGLLNEYGSIENALKEWEDLLAEQPNYKPERRERITFTGAIQTQSGAKKKPVKGPIQRKQGNIQSRSKIKE